MTTPEVVTDLPTFAQAATPTFPPKCPWADCQLPIDIVFRSVDGLLLGGHSSVLETYSEGFPAVSNEVTVDEGPVALTESGKTLKTLFRLTHKRKYEEVDLAAMGISLLLDVAEAAEKYFIYHVMEICRLHIKTRWRECPGQVLSYAVKHEYLDIADLTAQHTIGGHPQSMAPYFEGNVRLELAWLRYYYTWLEVAEFAITQPEGYVNSKRKTHVCNESALYYKLTLLDLPRTTKGILEGLVQGWIPGGYYATHLAQVKECIHPHCYGYAQSWDQRIMDLMSKVPKFRTFL